MNREIVPAVYNLLNVTYTVKMRFTFAACFYSNVYLNSFLPELEGYLQNKSRRGLSNGFFRRQSESKEKKKDPISPFPPNCVKATIYKIHILLDFMYHIS